MTACFRTVAAEARIGAMFARCRNRGNIFSKIEQYIAQRMPLGKPSREKRVAATSNDCTLPQSRARNGLRQRAMIAPCRKSHLFCFQNQIAARGNHCSVPQPVAALSNHCSLPHRLRQGAIIAQHRNRLRLRAIIAHCRTR